MSPLAVIPTYVLLIHPLVCVEGILAFTHTAGIHSAYPWHQLCIVIDLQLKFPRFHQPIDKASCDAFPIM